MTDVPGRRAVLLLAGAALLATAGCADLPPGLRDAPDPFTFARATHQLPGALVVSNRVLLTGMESRDAAMVYAEGGAEKLFVNGKDVGTRASVTAPARIAIAVRAPSAYGETAVGRVRVNGTVEEFQVTTASEPPRDRLAFGTAKVAPGRAARTPVMAPTGIAPGSTLKAVGLPTVQAETLEGRFDLPIKLDPGQPFRLVAKVPETFDGPLDVKVRLGELRGVWRLRPAEPKRERPAEEPKPAAGG